MLSKVWPVEEPAYKAPRAYFPTEMRRALARAGAAFVRAVIGQGAAIGAASLNSHLLRDIGIEHPCRARSRVQEGASSGG
ncbi:MAG: hypothetical protein AAF495_01250 [Pseudomonadota bacterium]